MRLNLDHFTPGNMVLAGGGVSLVVSSSARVVVFKVTTALGLGGGYFGACILGGMTFAECVRSRAFSRKAKELAPGALICTATAIVSAGLGAATGQFESFNSIPVVERTAGMTALVACCCVLGTVAVGLPFAAIAACANFARRNIN